jgi:hypothetical protein
MSKTSKKSKRRAKPTSEAVLAGARGSAHWAQCYLEHAARETAWAAQSAKECNYSAAHDAVVRRGVWLHAALLAQEKSAPNTEATDRP